MHLPVNRDAELGVIGACLDGGIETTVAASEKVPTRAFFHDDLRIAYECIQQIVQRGQTPDTYSVLTAWKQTAGALPFPDALWDCQDKHPKFHLAQRSEAVLDCWARRNAILSANALVGAASDLGRPIIESIAECEASLSPESLHAPPILEPKAAVVSLTNDLERRFELGGALSGISTGFTKWDAMTNGLQAGEVWIIGARPSVGKTALALNVASEVALKQRQPILFVSLEMSALALTRRLLSANAMVNGNSIRRGTFTEQEFKSMAAFNAMFSQAPFYILDSPGGIRIGQLCHSLRAAIRRWRIKVIFLDYLQKIRPDSRGEKRTYEIADTSAALVELTKRENINLFALAQLNREPEKDKGKRPPRLSDLADSKSIEADADFVGLLDRPIDGDETQAALTVAKQRDGERGVVPLTFQGWFCRFRSQV